MLYGFQFVTSYQMQRRIQAKATIQNPEHFAYVKNEYSTQLNMPAIPPSDNVVLAYLFLISNAQGQGDFVGALFQVLQLVCFK